MNHKIRITLTATLTIEPDPALYDPGATVEEMAAVEQKNIENDPLLLLDNAADVTVKTEIIYA